MHPASTVSRPVRLFIAENKLPVEEELVDIMTGAHHQEPFSAINPNRLVPVLEDGDLRLTESSAILKYLADKFDLPTYPKDLKRRAKVNEMMDWFNTNFYRDWGYGVIYPQIFPHHKRPTDDIQAGTIAWGKGQVAHWLNVLNSHWLGDGRPYLCGDEITIADYFGIGLISLGEIIHCDLGPYPNIQRWTDNVKRLEQWGPVNEVFYGIVESVKDVPFDSV
jgi:glutathione S-transferase